MASKRVSPLFELTQIQSRINQLFEALSEARSAYTSAPSGDEIVPEADVYETQDAMVAVFEVPGTEISALRLRVERGHLVLEGEKRHTAARGKSSKFHCVERGFGKFRRAVAVVCPVNSHAAQAVLDNGILTVRMPKVEERRGRVVDITVTRRDARNKGD